MAVSWDGGGAFLWRGAVHYLSGDEVTLWLSEMAQLSSRPTWGDIKGRPKPGCQAATAASLLRSRCFSMFDFPPFPLHTYHGFFHQWWLVVWILALHCMMDLIRSGWSFYSVGGMLYSLRIYQISYSPPPGQAAAMLMKHCLTGP